MLKKMRYIWKKSSAVRSKKETLTLNEGLLNVKKGRVEVILLERLSQLETGRRPSFTTDRRK
jgi:hypothetical protein